jgi:hypothetical protein
MSEHDPIIEPEPPLLPPDTEPAADPIELAEVTIEVSDLRLVPEREPSAAISSSSDDTVVVAVVVVVAVEVDVVDVETIGGGTITITAISSYKIVQVDVAPASMLPWQPVDVAIVYEDVAEPTMS